MKRAVQAEALGAMDPRHRPLIAEIFPAQAVEPPSITTSSRSDRSGNEGRVAGCTTKRRWASPQVARSPHLTVGSIGRLLAKGCWVPCRRARSRAGGVTSRFPSAERGCSLAALHQWRRDQSWGIHGTLVAGPDAARRTSVARLEGPAPKAWVETDSAPGPGVPGPGPHPVRDRPFGNCGLAVPVTKTARGPSKNGRSHATARSFVSAGN